MKRIIPAVIAAVAIAMCMTDRAEAQYPVQAYYPPVPVTAYYPPTTVYRPVRIAPPVATYYRAPAAIYTAPVPVTSYYGPAPVAYGYGPTVMYRPVVGYYSPYGGPEVRVPGQPVRNTLRAIVP